MSEPAEPAKAPAGIVVTPGIDDVLAALEKQVDHLEYQQKFFEGAPLPEAELEFHRQLWRQIVPRCNELLAGRVRLLGVHPELNGFGARLYGTDSDNRQYQLDFHYDDELRMANARMDSEALVRESVDLIVGGVLQKRAEYLHRMTGGQTGAA